MMRRERRFIRDIRIAAPQDESDYPFSIPSIKQFGSVQLHENVTYFIGENGTGKSTLLEALAISCRFNPEGGNRNTLFSSFDTTCDLHKFMEVDFTERRIDGGFFFRAETMYNLFSAGERELWRAHGWGGRHEASHGEGHLKLFQEKLHKGFFIFDEPESAFSPEKQMAFLTIISDLIANGSQIVISTHSPIVLAYPDAWIYSLDAGGPQRIDYDDAGCVQMYQMFMRNRERMVSTLCHGDT